MGKFTPQEISYLQSQRYGRLATVSQNGELHDIICYTMVSRPGPYG